MNILYGVAGEGFGHSSRTRVVVKYLESKGHKVVILTHDQTFQVLRKEKFRVIRIRGLRFSYSGGKVKKFESVKNSLKSFFGNVINSIKIKKLMNTNFDLCITDMEPLVTILSSVYQIPLVSIDNQHRLVNFDVKVPRSYKQDFLIAKTITLALAYNASYNVVIDFAKPRIKKKYLNRTFLVPPIIRDSVKKLKPRTDNFILVYLSKGDINLVDKLKQIDEKFIIYGFDVEKKDKNLIFKKTGDRFVQDLGRCKAIIATAGFSLISEALYLKKPYFAIPILHFEQTLNAIFLKNSGFGDYSDSPSKEDMEKFLKNLKTYQKNLASYNCDDKKIFEALDMILNRIKKGD